MHWKQLAIEMCADILMHKRAKKLQKDRVMKAKGDERIAWWKQRVLKGSRDERVSLQRHAQKHSHVPRDLS